MMTTVIDTPGGTTVNFLSALASLVLLCGALALTVVYARSRAWSIRARLGGAVKDRYDTVVHPSQVLPVRELSLRIVTVVIASAQRSAIDVVYLPSRIVVIVSPGDHERIVRSEGGRSRVVDDLYVAIVRKAAKRGIDVPAGLILDVIPDRMASDGRPYVGDPDAIAAPVRPLAPVVAPASPAAARMAPTAVDAGATVRYVGGPPRSRVGRRRTGTRLAGHSAPWPQRVEVVDPPTEVDRAAELVDERGGAPHRIVGREAVIGRRDADLIISDDVVSANHARITCTGGEWAIEDLGSSNGTWINGARITKTSLIPNDRVAFAEGEGPVFTFQVVGGAP